MSPIGPGGPVGPAAPCGPCGPSWPRSPRSPVSPCGPGGPAMPVGPIGPAGPIAPKGRAASRASRSATRFSSLSSRSCNAAARISNLRSVADRISLVMSSVDIFIADFFHLQKFNGLGLIRIFVIRRWRRRGWRGLGLGKWLVAVALGQRGQTEVLLLHVDRLATIQRRQIDPLARLIWCQDRTANAFAQCVEQGRGIHAQQAV